MNTCVSLIYVIDVTISVYVCIIQFLLRIRMCLITKRKNIFSECLCRLTLHICLSHCLYINLSLSAITFFCVCLSVCVRVLYEVLAVDLSIWMGHNVCLVNARVFTFHYLARKLHSNGIFGITFCSYWLACVCSNTVITPMLKEHSSCGNYRLVIVV